MIMVIISPGHTDSSTRWLALAGMVILSGVVASLILHQAARHRMAKHRFIELERGRGLYQEGWIFPGKTAYSQHWQTDWLADRRVTTHLTILTILTALVVCAMLIRP